MHEGERAKRQLREAQRELIRRKALREAQEGLKAAIQRKANMYVNGYDDADPTEDVDPTESTESMPTDMPDRESKKIVQEAIRRLKSHMDMCQEQADRHRKLVQHYQDEHDYVRNFLANDYWKSGAPAKSRKDPF